MPNKKVFISYGSKVIAKVKVDNRQTERQDKNNMPPFIRYGGHKNKNRTTVHFKSYDCEIPLFTYRLADSRLLVWLSFRGKSRAVTFLLVREYPSLGSGNI